MVERFVHTDVLPEPIDVTAGSSDQLDYDITLQDGVVDQFLAMQKQLRDMVEYIYSQIGLDRFSQNQHERGRIKQAFLNDPHWKPLVYHMMSLFIDPMSIRDMHMERIADKRPFFNELMLPIVSYQLSADGTLKLFFEPSFSYLLDAGLWQQSSAGSSIGGMVISPGEQGETTSLALRGGNSHRDTYMLMPAGYISLLDGDGHPMVKAFISELTDETGLTMPDIKELFLLGITQNNAMGNANVMPIFSATTDLSPDERDEKAVQAKDAHEHQAYEHFKLTDVPFKIQSHKPYDPAYPHQPENHGAILPQAANPLIVLAEQRRTLFSHEVEDALAHMSKHLRSTIAPLQPGAEVMMDQAFPQLQQKKS